MSNPFLKNNNNNRFNLLNDDPKVNDKRDKRDNRGRRYNDNRFKTNISEQPKLDINNIKAFPTLVNTKECDTIVQNSTKFKDILNNVIEEDIIENKDIILPGWLQLTMLNGKVLKKEYKEVKVVEEDQEELNYNMYKIGNALQTNYEIYEKVYDSINGEGSYDTNFRLSPVYGSEYDSNSSSESESQENIDHDDEYEN